jgi:predicted HicB family RNase H-like nuclease
MNRLEYKGYSGSVEYNKEDDCLFGKVLGLTAVYITYEGHTINELRDDFKGAIDDYLERCKEKGVKPAKAFNGVLNIRIPSDIHSKVALLAESSGISVNAFIRRAIEHEVRR